MRVLLYSHYEVVGKFLETNEISLDAQICENQTKKLGLKVWKIFGKSSVSYL